MENMIFEFRTAEGLTQEQLAERSCLSVGYICRLEKGTKNNPTYNAMKRIAKALNKEVNEVFI